MDSVGVVIPARNEQQLLPACLAAIRRAVTLAALPGVVVVVLDDCTDRSRAVVERHREMVAVSVSFHNVGQARRAGFEVALRRLAGMGLVAPWLATTDADSRVPDDWLQVQLQLGREGAEAVAGTVAVSDWQGRPEGLRSDFQAGYSYRDGHTHVHGANLGLSAAAYLRAGGVPPWRLAEDAGLISAVARDSRLVRTARIPVLTSARGDPRARGGFGDYLNHLETATRAGGSAKGPGSSSPG